MDALADVTDLSDWIGEAISGAADTQRAKLALRFASALVRRETKRTWLDESGDLVADLPDEVVLVTLASAGRGYTNPEGIVDESLDDWRGRKPDEAASFALTAAEKDMLLPYSSNGHSGLGTVSTTRGDLCPDPDLDLVSRDDIEHHWGRRL